ncbi:Helix-turn-helix domain-containing protein [Halomicrobium zhouii]|uniref:Helix-turn-helix domain-containing protein n=1 Tax=Halomicrobium zhouii TaxID=767519 RepID=A0A1I6LY17_9EURY|nr:helix-turn-helix domain-containing protein [Halomicrobium zhouii]SFS08369.1 Helix-turn-helix domain-containing protein [Halomicrobium zhouii]
MSLLPSRGPDVSTAQEGEMEVIGVDEDVDGVLDALASNTARAVLNAIYDDPGTPSEIADRLDMSIQKVSYHLEKLEDEELIAVAGTRYSEKGQEMNVYEPPEDPLVLFVGTRERKDSLRTMVKRLLPTVGILALASVAVQRFLGRDGGGGPVSLSSGAGGADSGDGNDLDADYEAQDQAATQTEAATSTQPEFSADSGDGGSNFSVQDAETTETAAETATEAPTQTPVGESLDTTTQVTEAVAGSAGISPGVAFFLGGLLVVALLVGWWGYRTYGR